MNDTTTERLPFVDLRIGVAAVTADALQDFREVLEECAFVGGPRVRAFEGALARALDVPYAVACSSGTAALVLALQAMGVQPGMVVAMPNVTFFATYEAVVQVGAIPLLIDIDPDDAQMSVDGLRAAHEAHRFEAVILVHLFGWASGRLDEARGFCAERGIRVVEDGAQAFGVQVAGRSVFAGARVATLSFSPAKVVGGAMDGGAVLTSDPVLAERVRSLSDHGRTGQYAHGAVGWNARMGGLGAAYLARVCARGEEIVGSRRARARYYEERLRAAGLGGSGAVAKPRGAARRGRPAAHLLTAPKGIEDNGYRQVTIVKGVGADEVARALHEKGVGTGRTYPSTIDEQPGAAGARRASDLRHGKAFCRSVLNLPLYYGITEEQCERACATLLTVLG